MWNFGLMAFFHGFMLVCRREGIYQIVQHPQPTNIAWIFAWWCFFGTPFPFIGDHQPRFMMKNYHTNFTHTHTHPSTLPCFFLMVFLPLIHTICVFLFMFFWLEFRTPWKAKCPIFKAIVAGFRGFSLPKKIGHKRRSRPPKNPHKNHTKFRRTPHLYVALPPKK